MRKNYPNKSCTESLFMVRKPNIYMILSLTYSVLVRGYMSSCTMMS